MWGSVSSRAKSCQCSKTPGHDPEVAVSLGAAAPDPAGELADRGTPEVQVHAAEAMIGRQGRGDPEARAVAGP